MPFKICLVSYNMGWGTVICRLEGQCEYIHRPWGGIFNCEKMLRTVLGVDFREIDSTVDIRWKRSQVAPIVYIFKLICF